MKGNILGHLAPIGHDASEVDYDNTTSGLTSTEIQSAIDEVVASIPAPTPTLWTRNAGTSTLEPNTANDNIDIGSGNFVTAGNVDGRDVSADGSALDSHLDGGSHKHDASEVDVEGTYANISGTPTDLENTVSAINTKLGTIVTDHGALSGLSDDDHTQYTQKATLTTDGDMYYRSSGVVSRLPIGTSGQFLKTNSSALPEWTTVSLPTPNREIIVSSGGSTAVNTAITTINGLGGGYVRIDGIIDMDGDITMKSGVQLVGYGPGTGLRNNTANNYKINFIGTTPTYYGIASPSSGADYITTDTAANAGNFSAGDYVIVKCSNSLVACNEFLQVKINGDTGTGIIRCYENVINKVGFLDAASEAAPLKTPVKDAGFKDIDIWTSSSGTLTIDVQYAVNIRFDNCHIYECQVTLHDCGRIIFTNCEFDSLDSTAHSIHVLFTYWVHSIFFINCIFRNANYAIYWSTTYTSFTNVKILGCIFECWYGVYWYGSTKSAYYYCDISNNHVTHGELQASGGGAGEFFKSRAYVYSLSITNNLIVNENANYQIDMYGGSYAYNQALTIANNTIDSSIYIEYLYESSLSNNTTASFVLDYGPYRNSIVGNSITHLYMRDSNARKVYGNSVCGNKISGACYFDGDSTRPFEGNAFTGNTVGGAVSAADYFYKNVFSSNVFNGNLTLTSGASQTWTKNVFSNNYCGGSVTFTEANQSDNVIVGNLSDTAITTLTGSNNEVVHNVVY